MKIRLSSWVTIIMVAILFAACEKEYDFPPEKEIPTGKLITIDSLFKMYVDSIYNYVDSATGATRTYYKFVDDYSLYATVTMDERSGNIYKTTYIQDQDTNAIKLNLLFSGGVTQGDYIRVALKGAVLLMDNDEVVLDSVDTDVNVIKIDSGADLIPIELSLDTINPIDYQNVLVKLKNVEFESNVVGKTFANPNQGWFKEYNLINCSESASLLVHTSDYCNFAGDTIPSENGDVIGIMGQYRGSIQFIIRNPDENTMTATRCTTVPILLKDFEDASITSGGWQIVNMVGNINWSTNTIGAQFGTTYGQISNYVGGNIACETWLVSPAMDLTASTTPVFSFQNAYKYTGDAITVWVSTDYTGSAPDLVSSTWTQLTPTLSSGNFAWVSSGNMDLTTYKSTATYVAIKYTGTSSSGSTWEIDDLVIEEQ